MRNYCFNNNLKKTGKDKYTPPPKSIIPYTPPVAPVFERVKGEYSSGHEAVIEKYLKKEK